MRTIAERLSEIRRNNDRYQLNPLLFNEDDKLKPEIKSKVLEIVDAFLEYTQVDIRVLDIRLVGSNAAYNYTSQSDLDIHIVTDLSEISDPEVIARLYFDSIKKQFKDSYDIKVKGIDVELYIEDVNTSSVSNGIYSVTKDEWIREPQPVEETEEAHEESIRIAKEIMQQIKSAKDTDELQEIIDKLYIMRKDSLSAQGETGEGNLAFKYLRNKGVLDNVKKILRDTTSKELSLESKCTSVD